MANIKGDIFATYLKLSLYEDTACNIKMLYHAKSMMNLNIDLYLRNKRNDSMSMKISSKDINNIKNAFFSIIDYFENNNLPIDYKYPLMRIKKDILLQLRLINDLVENKEEVLREFIDVAKDIVNEYSKKIDIDSVHSIFNESSPGWFKEWYNSNIV